MLEWPERHPKNVWEWCKRKADRKIIKGRWLWGWQFWPQKLRKEIDSLSKLPSKSGREREK